MPLNEAEGGPAGNQDPAVEAAVVRLSDEFAETVHVPTISRVVLGSRHDLSGVPDQALPELVERLARQRLLEATAGRTDEPRASLFAHQPREGVAVQ